MVLEILWHGAENSKHQDVSSKHVVLCNEYWCYKHQTLRLEPAIIFICVYTNN